MNAQLKNIQVGITRNNRVVRELQLTSFDDSNSARSEAATTTRTEVRAQIAEVGPRRSAAASSVAGGNLIEKAVLNTAETLLATWIGGRSTTVSPLIDPSAPEMFTVGNFAPVDRECPPDENVEIESGTIPSCLNGGVYLRNGGNPRHEPGFGYHYFDGDGMLHIVKFCDGKATYCCRYIRTNRYATRTSFH
jgi:9-cis-epoxycarotenoid dioxygenase